MRFLKYLCLLTAAGCLFFVSTPQSHAQVAVTIGAQPVCPYGYYDYAPYTCAPYGYYGPEWFTGGVFIGAGPWFHGPSGFNGHVNNHFDVQHGYHGPTPQRGEHATSHPHSSFHGNEMRDGRGHTVSGHGHK